jgi:glycosyltransferase involved in cell wall biosynthesis
MALEASITASTAHAIGEYCVMIGAPLVSVVVIFRDAERFLDEAVQSIWMQTYENWELLLVDDGSIDASTTLAWRWVERRPARIQYLEHAGHANRGMSASRNLGIGRAQGDYIAFLDADDVWLQPKLERQVRLLEAWPDASMVYGPTRWWYSWSGHPNDQQRDFVHPLGVPAESLIQPPALLGHLIRNEGASPCTCSILVRRDTVRQVGGFENAFTGLYEDQAFCAKICLRYAVIASSECLYLYRQHPDSACAVAARTGQARPSRHQFLMWLENYLSAQQVSDARLWNALRDELWRVQHPLLEHARIIARRMGHALASA